MLVDIAVVTTTSALNSVAEAFVVHENDHSLVAALSVDGVSILPVDTGAAQPLLYLNAAAASPADVPILGSMMRVGQQITSSELSSLTGARLLRQLGLLPAANLSTFLAAHPSVVSELLATPPAAREVSSWWSGLTADSRQSMHESASQLVGNLDGVPVGERYLANQRWLDESISQLESTVESSPGRTVVAESRRQINMLEQVTETLRKASDGPIRSLLSVDPEGQGRAAVVLGDLASADYVTYLVPGMFFTVEGQISDWTDDAARIYAEQVEWVQRAGLTDANGGAAAVAVVSWMGYETPNLTNIGTLDLAYEGRDAIAAVVQGLQAERAGDEPHITIVAHSYGSTAALMALTEYNFEVDALIVVGSPGSAAQSADDLHVADGNVFVGEAAWDPVPNSAFFGSDPGSAEYGAHRLDVDAGIDPITSGKLSQSIGHNGYFTEGSASLRNIAVIGVGQSDLVTGTTEPAEVKFLARER